MADYFPGSTNNVYLSTEPSRPVCTTRRRLRGRTSNNATGSQDRVGLGTSALSLETITLFLWTMTLLTIPRCLSLSQSVVANYPVM